MAATLLLTCEHGGNRVPRRHAAPFRGAKESLASHRGYDPGALDLARLLAERLDAPLVFATVTRLLVDLNRTLTHPQAFSEFTRGLPEEELYYIIGQYYWPYRLKVERLADETIQRLGRVVHVSVHTFTPILAGVERTADVALLYDPRRRAEVAFCRRWLKALRQRRPDLRLRRNYPYRGASDGLTTHLRQRWSTKLYAGIELEVNQRWPQGDAAEWIRLQDDLAATLGESLRSAR